jgi:hypothetical protein
MSSDKWAGGYSSGEQVTGPHGDGVVLTKEFVDGKDPGTGKSVRRLNPMNGLVPVLFEGVAYQWMYPHQLTPKEAV